MKNIILTIVIIVASAATGLAQQITTLEECLSMALSNNPTMQSGLYSIARAKDLQGTAWDLPSTEISLSQTPVDGGGPDNAVTFKQSFEFPTIYKARHSKLKAMSHLEEVKYEMSRLELEKEVTMAYYTMLAALETRKALQAQDSVYSHSLFLANARLKAGEAGRLEQINAKRLLDACRLMSRDADIAVTNAEIRLQNLLNTDREIVPKEDKLPAIEVPLDRLAGNFNPYESPTLRVLSQEREVAEKEVGIARQSFLPEISLGASTQALIKSFNPYDIERSRFSKGNFMGFEVGVSIPLFFGAKKSALKAAKRDVEINRVQMEAELQRVTAEFRTVQNDYLRSQKALDYHLSVANKDAAEIQRIAQVSYEKGDIDYLEYIQNIQVAMEQQLSYIDALDAYNKAAIALLFIQPISTSKQK